MKKKKSTKEFDKKSREDIVRAYFEMPAAMHLQMKIAAAKQSVSMRHLFLCMVEKYLDDIKDD